MTAFDFPLFVPADRPERISKAAASGADCVFIDLEDAVASQAKASARIGLVQALAQLPAHPLPIFLRINASGTPWHADDLAALAILPVAGVVLPKAEHPEDLKRLAAILGDRARVVALVESASGLAQARLLARSAGRLAFGSIDFAADLGCAHSREALLLARLELVLASRLAGLPGPIDGVTTAIDRPDEILDDAAHAASLGFAGKLLIHPRQIIPARQGFAPSEADVNWARRVLDAAGDGAAIALDGAMVDAPVIARARQIIARSASRPH
ncbi:HpcH/HpaI aldolase/citrate lyase family protein [Geminicoccus roseus]|uniref:HpcH/HpaI aldolase/citrate lyase family protein n=1 Tax=Geminicoccus roseus TaxID=404900 RepID=UPI00041A9AC0|nr:CoA ester lyase [Geminicoccus roseus]